MEIGVFDGKRAVEMMEATSLFSNISENKYFGFDLFEDLTDELLESEFSKRPKPMDEIQKFVGKTGALVKLHKGFTQETLPDFVDKCDQDIDFILIDGGHAVETIRSDWENVERLMTDNSVVVFDDFYTVDGEFEKSFGCNEIIKSLDEKTYEIEMLSPQDKFMKDFGLLGINMVKVSRRH